MAEVIMIMLPRELVLRISELLCDIAEMKPGFEIYDKSVQITKDLYLEMKKQ